MTAALEGGEWSAARPGRTLPPGKTWYPFYRRLGWAPGPVWTDGKSRPHWDSIPDRPARRQSLYRLSYPDHIILTVSALEEPYLLSESDNFTPTNPLVTTVYIQQEWYFLFAYAILRSIPNKLGEVIALVISIAILFIIPTNKSKFRGTQFYPVNQVLFWTITGNGSQNILTTVLQHGWGEIPHSNPESFEHRKEREIWSCRQHKMS